MKQSSETHDPVKLNAAIIKMDDLGAWDFDAKVKQVLGKLNIHHLQQIVNDIKRWSTQTGSSCKNLN